MTHPLKQKLRHAIAFFYYRAVRVRISHRVFELQYLLPPNVPFLILSTLPGGVELSMCVHRRKGGGRS